MQAGAGLWFATNNSTRSPRSISRKMMDVTGVEVPADSIVTSSQAAVHLLGDGGGPVMVLGGEGIHTALAEAGDEVFSG